LPIPFAGFFSYRFVRLALVAIAITLCLFAIRSAASFGFSRVLATYAFAARNVAAAQKAVEVAPGDAEAHFASALSLGATPQQSITELERAVALRPADYTLWRQLGLFRDQTGDTSGALQAFDNAIARAPHYSQPRWDRGNVLLRSRQYEAAFKDLNEAAQSKPELIPSLIELAWGMSRGDVKLTEQLVEIKNEQVRIAFAKLLARQGKAQEAIAQFGGAASVPDEIKNELIDQLLSKAAYHEAFDIWKAAHGISADKESSGPSIYDGGFEGPLSFGAGGFGWRVPRDLQGTSISLDARQAHSGSQNLRIEFSGNSNPGATLLSQLVLLEPSQRYKINFMSRSQDVLSGGLPLLVVTSPSGDLKRLGQSTALAKGTSGWQPFSLEFTTPPNITAVMLSIQRENCTTSPCPIFGAVSLDSFSIERLR
jgi:tetratricopeptide (TPR) repeat protein